MVFKMVQVVPDNPGGQCVAWPLPQFRVGGGSPAGYRKYQPSADSRGPAEAKRTRKAHELGAATRIGGLAARCAVHPTDIGFTQQISQQTIGGVDRAASELDFSHAGYAEQANDG